MQIVDTQPHTPVRTTADFKHSQRRLSDLRLAWLARVPCPTGGLRAGESGVEPSRTRKF